MTFGTLFRRSKMAEHRHFGHGDTMVGSGIQRASQRTEMSFDASSNNLNLKKNIETISLDDETNHPNLKQEVSKAEEHKIRRPGLSSSVRYLDKSVPAKAVLGLVLVVCSNVGFTAIAQTTSGLPPPCDR